jgi:HSP20 family protein
MFARTLLDELNDFRRSFDQTFDGFYNAGTRRTGERAEFAFTPTVESGWTNDHLNLRVVLPGVAEKDLKITVQGSQLTIQGERSAPENFGEDTYFRMAYGKFERTLELPAGLDVDNLKAHLHDGVLDIRVPVAAAAKPKQIPISTGTAKSLAA